MLSNKIRILAVDDKEENLTPLKSILESPSCTVTTALSGRDALRLIMQEEAFTLILLDVRMPDMDGFEIATMIRQSDRNANIPIIFLTAYDANNEDIRKGYILGGVDFIQKPFNMEILKAKVEVFADLHCKDLEIRRQSKQLSTANVKLADTNRKLMERQQELADKVIDLEKAEEQIRKSLAEKEVLMKEIHHRVKNNLQVISSLIGLQSDGLKDESVRKILQNMISRVRSIALVHEKLCQTSDLAHIDFGEYARSLLNKIWSANGTNTTDLRMTLDIQSVSLSTDTAVTCGLILNELVVNALEHAFQGRVDGEVTVSLHNGDDRRIHLCVADNGVGLPAGFDLRQTKSLGLRLVQMLSKQIDANVGLGDGDGTRFEIVFELQDSFPT